MNTTPCRPCPASDLTIPARPHAALCQARRAETRDELRPARGTPDATTLDEIAVEAIARKRIAKWRTTSLGDWVEQRLDDRVLRTGGRFFTKPYDSRVHRAPFVAFLSSLVEGSSGGSRALARRFAMLLAPLDRPGATMVYGGCWPPRLDANRRWLGDFFEDEPDWRARLSAWVYSRSEDVGSGRPNERALHRSRA
jgi:hypothetical protein